MTKRSFIIGIFLTLVIIFGRYFNDCYMKQTEMVGSTIPVFVFGALILIIIIFNASKNRFNFSAVEMAVIMSLMFSVCCIPRTFITNLIMPFHWIDVYTEWQESNTLDYYPDKLMITEAKTNPEILEKFMLGQQSNKKANGIEVSSLFLSAWLKPLSYWIPFYIFLMFSFVGLALVIHTQWSANEHLTYPVAEFANYIFGLGKDNENKHILKVGSFWIGILIFSVYYLINWLNAWHPSWIKLPDRLDIRALSIYFPTISVQFEANRLWNPDLVFPAIAFAFFLPTQISFSLGISHFLSLIVSAACVIYGYQMTRAHAGAGDLQGILVGAFIGQLLILLYTGRNYYWQTLTRALGFNKNANIDNSSVLGFRIFLVCGAIVCFILSKMGLIFPFSILTFLLIVLMYVVIGRISAESGVYVIYPWWLPSGVLLGIFGAPCLGPQLLAICMLVSVMVIVDPRDCFMPFLLNALYVSESGKINKKNISIIIMIFMAVGLILTLITILYLHYTIGNPDFQWVVKWVPYMGPNLISGEIIDLKLSGDLEKSLNSSLFERLRYITPKKEFMSYMLLGFLLFIISSILRLIFNKWPIHPVLFLVWFTGPIARYWFSFFLGWLIKYSVFRFGGQPMYQQLKPFMVGIIAAALLTGFIFMLFGFFYFWQTGFSPPEYRTI